MQHSTATSDHVMLVSKTYPPPKQPPTQRLAFTHPSSHANIHRRSPQTARCPRKTIRAHSQPATHANDIHARAPVQQQPHTLHVSSLTGTMKCRHAVALHSAVNRNRQHCIQRPYHAYQLSVTTSQSTQQVAFTHPTSHTNIHKRSPRPAQNDPCA
jgi:hypothetical protein